MNILITGASGFIGTALLKYIEKNKLFQDDKIVLLTSRPLDGYSYVLHNNYTFSKQDFLAQGIDETDLVFHLGAAAPKTRQEFGTGYIEKFTANVLNTAHLIENLPSVPQKVIFISSVSVYEQATQISEDTPLQVSDMYGASKLMCEAYLTQQAARLGFTLQILRLGQIYGEGEETYSKIVSFFIKQILADKPITLFGTGNEKRSLLYVYDCIRAIIQAAQLPDGVGPINVASDRPITLRQLAELIYQVTGRKENYTIQPQKSAASVIYNTAKMQHYLPFELTDYRTGIANFYNYYKEKYGGQ